MAKTKVNDQVTTLKNWVDVDSNLNAIATRKNEVNSIEADMNADLIKIQDKYQPKLDALNSEIIGFEKNIELFCIDNKAEFGDKKSKELNYGVVSFRTGTGKLATLKGFTWDAVKMLVKNSKKLAAQFLRVKEDLDKTSLLKSGLKESELAKIGVYISQEESFSYEVFLKESQAVNAG
jgi:phage host-nuclease inhibitor protein Gam